jgi:hypothetical protein
MMLLSATPLVKAAILKQTYYAGRTVPLDPKTLALTVPSLPLMKE